MNAGSDGPGVERVLLGAAAFVVVVAGMKVAGGIIAPVALALVLVVALSPVREWLVRRRVPGWLATILLILVLLRRPGRLRARGGCSRSAGSPP